MVPLKYHDVFIFMPKVLSFNGKSWAVEKEVIQRFDMKMAM